MKPGFGGCSAYEDGNVPSKNLAGDAEHPIHGHHEVLRSEGYKPSMSVHTEFGRVNQYKAEGKPNVEMTYSKTAAKPVSHQTVHENGSAHFGHTPSHLSENVHKTAEDGGDGSGVMRRHHVERLPDLDRPGSSHIDKAQDSTGPTGKRFTEGLHERRTDGTFEPSSERGLARRKRLEAERAAKAGDNAQTEIPGVFKPPPAPKGPHALKP